MVQHFTKSYLKFPPSPRGRGIKGEGELVGHGKFILLLFLLFIVAACFGGIDKRGAVLSYVNGVVRTKGGTFHIGKLPPAWRREDTAFHALVFLNRDDQSSITVDSFCKGAFDDTGLKTLTRELTRGIEGFQVAEQLPVSLSQREALHTTGSGQVDGAPVFFESFVLKMNACVFDFVYISRPQELTTRGDFHFLVNGFHYVKGPKVLD